jgi:hypothetical protein
VSHYQELGLGAGEVFGRHLGDVLLAGGHNVIIRLILLQHEPHHFDEVLCVAPVPPGIQVAEIKAILEPKLDPGQARVILRVTKVSPRMGDSWLNRMPLLACIPYASR